MFPSTQQQQVVLTETYCKKVNIQKTKRDDFIQYVCRILVGKPKGKILIGRHRYEGEDNIRIDLKEIRSGSWNVYQGQIRTKLFSCENFMNFDLHRKRKIY